MSPPISAESQQVNAELVSNGQSKNGHQTEQSMKNGDHVKIDVICDESPVLCVELMNEDAKMPFKGSSKAAGFDLCSCVEKTIPARGQVVVETGLKLMLPPNCYGRIAPRSGLAANHSLDVGAGVVDEDYRGEIKVVLFNHSDKDFQVTKGMRIAQLVCERIFYPLIQQVDSVDETKRGEAGFGSTGTK